jgi:hypothetical protein
MAMGHGGHHHGADRTLEAFRPVRDQAERIGRPVEFVDELEDGILLKAGARLGEGMREK